MDCGFTGCANIIDVTFMRDYGNRPIVRRHSFPNVRDLAQESSTSNYTHKHGSRPHLKRLVRERNRLWNHAILSVIVISLQIVLSAFLILAISVIWASVFMELPSMDYNFHREKVPSHADALSAWSEMAQSIYLCLGYRLLTSAEIKEALNNKLKTTWHHTAHRASINVFDLMPEGSYDPQLIVPMVLIVKSFDEKTGWFTAHLAGAMPFLRIHIWPGFQYNHGIYANGTVVLKLNGVYDSTLQFDKMFSLKHLESMDRTNGLENWSVEMLLSGVHPNIPLLPQPFPAEYALIRHERLTSILEEWRWEKSGWVSRLDDSPPVKSYIDPGAPVLPHFKRPIAVPEQIASLSPQERRALLPLWTLFFQRLLYTFVMGSEMQKRFRSLVERIARNAGGPFRIRVLEMDLGMPKWQSCPKLIMLNQLPQPYTYRMLLDINWPLMKIKLALDGSGHSSSIVFNVNCLKAKGPVVFGIEHPLTRDLSEGIRPHYISFSFERVPDIDFEVSLDTESTQVFGIPSSICSSWLHTLFNDYLLKPFVSRFTKMFLMGCAVSPVIAYIPWLEDPGNLKFNSNHAQSVFRWVRGVFATMHYDAEAVI